MRIIRYLIIFIIIFLVSCNNEIINNIPTTSAQTDEGSAEEATNITASKSVDKDLVESICFEIGHIIGTTYISYVDTDILTESYTGEIEKYEFKFDGEIYTSYGDRYAYIGNDYTNNLINELHILVYDKNGNAIDSRLYKKVFILDAADNYSISNINKDIFDAEILYVLNGDSLSHIDFVKDIKNLRCLYIEDADYLRNLSPLSQQTSLEILVLEDSRFLTDLTPIKNMNGLREVSLGFSELSNSQESRNLDIISKMNNLEKLGLTSIQYDNINFLKELSELKELVLHLNLKYIDFSIINELGNLEILELIGSGETYEIVNLKLNGNLKSLSVTRGDISGLSYGAENIIESLEFVNCVNVNFDGKPNLKKVNELIIRCEEAQNIGEAFGDELKSLHLSSVITDYSKLSKFTQLRELSIVGDFNNCTNIDFIANMDNLTSLNIYYRNGMDIKHIENSSSLKDLQIFYLNESMNFEKLVNLESLYLYGVHNIYTTNTEYIDVSSIGLLDSLRELILIEVEQNDFLFISDLTNLEYFEAYRCLIKQFPDLTELNNLQTMTIGDNEEIINLNSLSSCTSIKSLTIFGTDIFDLELLGEVSSLEVIALSRTNGFDAMALKNMENLRFLSTHGVEMENVGEFAAQSNAQIRITD